jgi:aerobic carbon-monoxide dehydrogenase medium subunit
VARYLLSDTRGTINGGRKRRSAVRNATASDQQVHVDENRLIDRASIVLYGVGETPTRAAGAEQCLQCTHGSPQDIAAAAEAAVEGLEATSDIHGSAEYRRGVARACVRRALEKALGRANGGVA